MSAMLQSVMRLQSGREWENGPGTDTHRVEAFRFGSDGLRTLPIDRIA